VPTDTESIRAKLGDPATNLADLAQISTILRNTTEAEKHRAEIAESTNKSEALRFWIPILAPTISALALVITLLVQIYQFQQNMEAQRRSAEDGAWRYTAQQLASAYPKGPAYPIALHQLESFFSSERYAEPARELSVTLLGHATDAEGFQILFPNLRQSTSWSHLDRLGRLGRMLNKTWDAVEADLKSANKQLADATTRFPGSARASSLQTQLDMITDSKHEVLAELQLVDDAIANILRSNYKPGVLRRIRAFLPGAPEQRPANAHPDLAGVYFKNTDLTSAQFDGAVMKSTFIDGGNLLDATLVGCDLNDAFLSPDAWKNSRWEHSAWWNAQYVTPNLLTYLKRRFRFQPGMTYVEKSKTDARTYAEAITLLETTNRVTQ